MFLFSSLSFLVLTITFDFVYSLCLCSYDEKATTEKILKKLKLENFQVCVQCSCFKAILIILLLSMHLSL